MHKLFSILPALLFTGAIASLAFAGTGCSGDFDFVGPPGGSAVGSPGQDPVFGTVPHTYTFADPLDTGWYNDVWYVDPGRDSDEGPGGIIGPWFADSMQTLNAAGFGGFITGTATVTEVEVNHQFPLMCSFMAQWFRRNGDGTRKRERDQFGTIIWSASSLDINLICEPVELIVYPGPQVVYEVFRQIHPNGPGESLFQWSSPPANSPGTFPSPQSRFLSNNYSECGLVLLTKLLQAGQPQLTQALGVPISDTTENDNVENIGSIPQTFGGGPVTVPTPTGVFGDLYSDEYIAAPIIKPNSAGHTQEEAEIEYSRHLGSLYSNLICQAIGLNSGEVGTIMDPEQVVFQNGYSYTFVQNDLDALDNVHLPGKKRDPNPGTPGVP